MWAATAATTASRARCLAGMSEMGLLTGGIAAIFSGVFSALYLDGLLHAGTGEPIYGPGGAVTGYTGGDDVPIKVQIDSASEAMRQADGFAQGDVRLIILARGMPALTSDHEVTIEGVRYSIQSVERDPAMSHWVCRGRVV